jgi:hypothetical protein
MPRVLASGQRALRGHVVAFERRFADLSRLATLTNNHHLGPTKDTCQARAMAVAGRPFGAWARIPAARPGHRHVRHQYTMRAPREQGVAEAAREARSLPAHPAPNAADRLSVAEEVLALCR